MGLFKRNNKLTRKIEDTTVIVSETDNAASLQKPAEPETSSHSLENPEQLLAGNVPLFLQEILDNLPDPVYFKDRNSRFILVNRALAQRVYSINGPEKAMGRTDFDFCPREQARRFFEDEQRIMETGEPLLQVEERQTLPDGREAWFLTSKFPLKEDGKAVGTWGFSRDITAQKNAEEDLKASEERLHQAQKMEAFGQLAGGIAHDFNNMLGVIIGAAQLLEQKLTDSNTDCKRHIDMLIDTVKRAADLTQQILAFARKGDFKMVPVEGREVIRTVVGLLRHTFDRRIRIVERLNASHSTIKGDFAQLQNVLLNLAINARDAMPEGGTLTFSTEEAGPGVSVVGHGPADFGSYLIVKVSDTGCGMDEKTKRRAFEPFFTTKDQGKGTGLGLASVYGTIKSHNGLIELESEPGKGTTFTLFLPLIAATAPKLKEERTPLEKGSGTIMVVDDEEDLRFIAGELIKSLGYNVVTCKDGVEAIDYYAVHHTAIDAVIVDIIMPRMGGYDCIIKLKQINPAARVLVSSGYGLPSDTQMIITKGIAGFIQKPFCIEELSQALSGVLKKNHE